MWVVGGAFPGVAAAVGQRRGWPTVFLRAVSADQCGFSCAVISRRLPKLVESLIAPKLLLTALFSFLSRQFYLRYIFFFFFFLFIFFFFFCIDTRVSSTMLSFILLLDLPSKIFFFQANSILSWRFFFLLFSRSSRIDRNIFDSIFFFSRSSVQVCGAFNRVKI